MALGDGEVTVTISRADGSNHSLAAEQAIAAIPPRLLEATVSFTPAMESAVARRWRETATWMAPHAKFFALYDRPFWREVGLSGTAQSMVGPLVEIHDATTASGTAALFGFLGVDANQRASVGEERAGPGVRGAVGTAVRAAGATSPSDAFQRLGRGCVDSDARRQGCRDASCPPKRGLGDGPLAASPVIGGQRDQHDGPGLPGGCRRCRSAGCRRDAGKARASCRRRLRATTGSQIEVKSTDPASSRATVW